MMRGSPTIPIGHRRNWLWRLLQFLLQNLFAFWLRYRARGHEQLPTSGGLLLANHQSYLDPMLIGLPLRRPVSYLARENLFRIPVVGWILRQTYVMPISRESTGTESLRESLRRIEAGYLVGMFPEGTRTSTGELGRLKPGFIALLRRARCPVVPVGIAGAFEAFPRGTILPRPGRVRVVFGEPIPFEVLEPLASRGCEAELVASIRARMQYCLTEAEAWRAQKKAGGPVDTTSASAADRQC